MKQRYINTKFWDDEYIAKLSPEEKLLFLYFISNTLTNIVGIYEIMMRRIIFDTGLDQIKITKILKKFSNDNKLFYSDCWIIIVNLYKHQARNEKIEKGARSEEHTSELQSH